MVEMNRRHNTTLVLVTHDHDLAARADRRISLRDGSVVSDETSAATPEGFDGAGAELEEEAARR
jgi:energy-coupling factor transporter ATP-binding protein EcfA2